MVGRRLIGLTAALCLLRASTAAEPQRPLAPLPADGVQVIPFFDGWHPNPDGSIALVFGYLNLNKTESVDIPYGPDNFITPPQYDGRQPTAFPPVPGDEPGAGAGSSTPDPRHRARGVFTITVPKDFPGDVVWTLRNRGQAYRVPGRAKSSAYQLAWKMAMGSEPPLLRFRPDGQAGRSPIGIVADAMHARVGSPLTVSVWLRDESVHEQLPVKVLDNRSKMPAKMNVTWYKYSGPGPIVFNPPREPVTSTDGRSSSAVTFTVPGEYVIRVRGDNFGEVDSLSGDQCCWTNGYVKVTVSP